MNATYDELVEMLRIDREKIERLKGFLRAEREHAEALKSVIQDIENAWRYGDLGINEHCDDHVRIPMERYKSVDGAINLAPSTSLGQRDARVAVEAGRMTIINLADSMDYDPFSCPLSSRDLRTIAQGYPSPDEVREKMEGGGHE